MNLSDYWVKGNMNRKLLYELNHKIVYDHTNEDYIYANTSFDGALNWNQADFSGDLPYTIDGITHIDGSIPKFDDQILLGENGSIFTNSGLIIITACSVTRFRSYS